MTETGRRGKKKLKGGLRSGAPPCRYSNQLCGSQVLRRLLWHERHGGAELFKAMEMVTFDACPILVIKIIGSQVGVGFLGP